MSEKIYEYDPVDALNSVDALEEFLDDAIKTGDLSYIEKAEAVANEARSRIDSFLAKDRSS